MSPKSVKTIKLIVMLAIVAAFVWFIFLYPMITFKGYEKQVREAAEKYYDYNPTKLPTGNRVSTIKLQTLFTEAYLKEDLYIPYTDKACSPVNSWDKTVKKDNNYKYYIYLECGALKSSIDHTGPQIVLKGQEEMTIEIGNDFKDPGVDRVVDKQDGYLDKNDVKVTSDVDATTPGKYEIKYSAVDKLGNKSEVIRKVNVVKTLANQIRNILGKDDRFTGNPENNNIRVSNMDFKIVGLDSNNNVIVVSDYPISYINYNKIDDWLNNYYYKLLSKKTKKMIVDSTYCKTVKDESAKECSSKTESKKIYYPSIADFNLAAKDDQNFMMTDFLSWINGTGDPTAIGYYNLGYNDELYKKMAQTDISTIRPMFTIKGNQKIVDGDGTVDKPFILKDNKKADGNSKITDLSVGDYISNKGMYYRIIDKSSDYVKVISFMNVGKAEQEMTFNYASKSPYIYNPTDKNNLGFKINNQTVKFLNKDIFITHEIKVPIYKDKIVYGEEETTKKYKVLFSAPNIFELYSNGIINDEVYYGGRTWYVNSSKGEDKGLLVDGIGFVEDKITSEETRGVKVVAYINKDQFITSGDGTHKNPYILK